LETVRVPPKTSTERKITAIWQEVLRIDSVGVHDNFFDLGGHSLLLMELQSRLCDTFDREVSIMQLFEFTTVHRQAELFSNHEPKESSFRMVQERARKQKESMKRWQRPK
jgi:acyl carrier protein